MLRNEEAPRWLGRLAVTALALVSLGVVLGPLAVLGGAWIGETREAPLRAIAPPPPVDLAPGDQILFGAPLTLDSALIVEAQFDSGADPLAWWSAVCQSPDGATVTYRLTADGYFSVPPLAAESRAFLHIRPPGQPNRLIILRGGAHLRINEEIAWDGAPPALHTCQLTAGSVNGPARLVVLDVSAR